MLDILTDHLGSVSAVLDDQGALLSQQRYLPFGGARLGPGVSQTDFGYTGQRALNTIGLMDYNARWYGQGIGRFTQPDTIVPGAGNPQALNRYSYVFNNPIILVDPSGHCPINGIILGGQCLGPSKPIEYQYRPYNDPSTPVTDGGAGRGDEDGSDSGLGAIGQNLNEGANGSGSEDILLDLGTGEYVPPGSLVACNDPHNYYLCVRPQDTFGYAHIPDIPLSVVFKTIVKGGVLLGGGLILTGDPAGIPILVGFGAVNKATSYVEALLSPDQAAILHQTEVINPPVDIQGVMATTIWELVFELESIETTIVGPIPILPVPTPPPMPQSTPSPP